MCGYIHTQTFPAKPSESHPSESHLQTTPTKYFSMNFLIRAFSYTMTTNTNTSEL